VHLGIEVCHAQGSFFVNHFLGGKCKQNSYSKLKLENNGFYNLCGVMAVAV
jgi:hypothetical protein